MFGVMATHAVTPGYQVSSNHRSALQCFDQSDIPLVTLETSTTGIGELLVLAKYCLIWVSGAGLSLLRHS